MTFEKCNNLIQKILDYGDFCALYALSRSNDDKIKKLERLADIKCMITSEVKFF